MLGGLAEFERELIRARTDEGRKRAQVSQRQEALARRANGEALVPLHGDFDRLNPGSK